MVFVEHTGADGAQRVLVTQLGVKALPNAEAQVGTDVEVVGAVVVGVSHHFGDSNGVVVGLVDDGSQLVDVFGIGNIGQLVFVLGVFPVKLSVAEADFLAIVSGWLMVD